MKWGGNANLFRNLTRVGEDDFGFVLVGRDFAGESDGEADVALQVIKFLRIIGEDDAREGTGFIALTEVEKDRAAFRRVRIDECTAHARGLADVRGSVGVVYCADRN